MPELIIVARITAKPDKAEFVEAELEKLIETTRSEEGCFQYDLHQDNADPAHFLFFERWESRELWQKHMGAEHLHYYKSATEGMIEEFTLNEMTAIP